LTQKPFSAFLVCVTQANHNGETFRLFVAEFLAPMRPLARPVSQALLVGVMDIRKVPSFSNQPKFLLSDLFGTWAEGDYRDWNAIRLWAERNHP